MSVFHKRIPSYESQFYGMKVVCEGKPRKVMLSPPYGWKGDLTYKAHILSGVVLRRAEITQWQSWFIIDLEVAFCSPMLFSFFVIVKLFLVQIFKTSRSLNAMTQIVFHGRGKFLLVKGSTGFLSIVKSRAQHNIPVASRLRPLLRVTYGTVVVWWHCQPFLGHST